MAALGDADSAVAALDRACEARFDRLIFINVEPMFDPLRDHPGFQEMAASISQGRKMADRLAESTVTE
jgi:hypothetical protein